MAKRMKLVDQSQSLVEKEKVVNWELCLICQEQTSESVQHPSKRKGEKGESALAGYKTLTENLLEFHALGLLPKTINIDILDEGNGIEAALITHNACWHRSCRIKYNNTKLDRARKRSKDKISDEIGESSPDTSKRVGTRSLSGSASSFSESICFFCYKPPGKDVLHEVASS